MYDSNAPPAIFGCNHKVSVCNCAIFLDYSIFIFFVETTTDKNETSPTNHSNLAIFSRQFMNAAVAITAAVRLHGTCVNTQETHPQKKKDASTRGCHRNICDLRAESIARRRSNVNGFWYAKRMKYIFCIHATAPIHCHYAADDEQSTDIFAFAYHWILISLKTCAKKKLEQTRNSNRQIRTQRILDGVNVPKLHAKMEWNQ